VCRSLVAGYYPSKQGRRTSRFGSLGQQRRRTVEQIRRVIHTIDKRTFVTDYPSDGQPTWVHVDEEQDRLSVAAFVRVSVNEGEENEQWWLIPTHQIGRPVYESAGVAAEGGPLLFAASSNFMTAASICLVVSPPSGANLARLLNGYSVITSLSIICTKKQGEGSVPNYASSEGFF
jgi:hypothetical protein